MVKSAKGSEEQAARTVIFPETRRGSCFVRRNNSGQLHDVDFPVSGFVREDPIIDSSILNLVTRFEDGDPVLISIREFVDDLSATMVALKNALKAHDGKWLDNVAQELSQYALKVGAVRVLKLCFEMQATARLSDMQHAEILAKQIEEEYKKAKETLSGYV